MHKSFYADAGLLIGHIKTRQLALFTDGSGFFFEQFSLKGNPAAFGVDFIQGHTFRADGAAHDDVPLDRLISLALAAIAAFPVGALIAGAA